METKYFLISDPWVPGSRPHGLKVGHFNNVIQRPNPGHVAGKHPTYEVSFTNYYVMLFYDQLDVVRPATKFPHETHKPSPQRRNPKPQQTAIRRPKSKTHRRRNIFSDHVII